MRLFLAILLGLLIGGGGYTFLYGRGFSYLSDDPATCKNCHIMNEHYDGWLKASHHAVATCNDCHTPHAMVPKHIMKAENGFWHSKGFTLNDFSEPIRIRPHNRQVVIRNCVACHRTLVGEVMITHGDDTSRLDCTRCHASVGHGPVR